MAIVEPPSSVRLGGGHRAFCVPVHTPMAIADMRLLGIHRRPPGRCLSTRTARCPSRACHHRRTHDAHHVPARIDPAIPITEAASRPITQPAR
jgi:hypothetical protein